ncbi:MAG: efflux transporter outer membrane subunit [Acidocella sp.]|nr:efflux transporter outer membrane subunit [Acidocella sp.]
MIRRICVGLLLAVGLSGCAIGPDYHRPVLAVPSGYKEAAGWVRAMPAAAAAKGDWWTNFDDAELNRLEAMVAVNNATLAADYDNYEQAQALVAQVRGGLFPAIGVTSGVTRAGQGSGAPPHSSASFEGSASWTPDIWGKIRRQVQEQQAAASVSEADLANATLSAEASLAADYVDLRASDAAISLFRQTVAADEQALRITQNQGAAGVALPSDVVTARAQLAASQAQLINAGAARAQYEHAIAVLTGQAPAALSIPAGPQIALVPVAAVPVPSLLLQRRPDIAAAERAMAQANAAVGVAVGAFYPDISLSALGGYAADPVGGLFSVSNSLWSLGANLTGTVFEGGTRRATVRAAEYAYDASVQSYRQTVLTAFQGVEDDLSSLRIYGQEAPVQAQAVADARQVLRIALNQYQAGTVNYTSVVSAQLVLLGDQENALSLTQNRLLASIALYQDVGGGFVAGVPRG